MSHRPSQPPGKLGAQASPRRPRAASRRPAGSGSPAPSHVAAGPLPADWSPLGAPHSPRAAPGSCTVTALWLPAFGMVTRFQGSGRRSTAAILQGGDGPAGGGASSGGGGALRGGRRGPRGRGVDQSGMKRAGPGTGRWGRSPQRVRDQTLSWKGPR